jgi:uncharacterized membrane-anchored protein YhcB (DUF1043 family)
LGTEIKKLIYRCKKETGQNLKTLSKELAHSERSLKNKQQEITQHISGETPFLKYLKLN